ncbi:MAG: ABC transporter substrate-binding protein, partial [Promethearchaeota archaeon]
MTVEKVSPKKKIPKTESFKKPIIIGGLIAVVAITGIISGIIIFLEMPKRGTLIVGITGEKIESIEPLTYINNGDQILICHITETLFENEYIDGKSQIKNNLAIGYEWNTNATEFTCFLREGVKFHDGTPFNAQSVKWNFDRVSQIIDPADPFIYWWGYLFFLPDGRWIINKTQVIDPYTIKFFLNDAFVPFQAFLTHSTTSILSPTSTPANRTLVIQVDKLIGTGPFTYDKYNPDIDITLYRNQNYWGIKPKIDKIILSSFPGNLTTRLDALW